MSDTLLAALERGRVALEDGRTADAVVAFEAAWNVVPGDPSVALALANAQRLAGDLTASRHTLIAASRARPSNDPTVSMGLGGALLDAGAPREAAACFARVRRLVPSDPAPVAALAGAMRMQGDPRTAASLIAQALERAPTHPAFLLTAAQVHHDLGDLAQARAFIDRADALRPGHGPTRLQRAYTTLLAGASADGWSDFEMRPLPVPKTTAQPWHGQPLAGESILVTAEQGIGDQFQFVRFARHLVARGAARVVVECHADAVAVLRASGVDAVPRDHRVDTTWHVPMLSLPHRLGLGSDVDGGAVPYLVAPSAGDTRLPPRASATRPRVGVVWAGNPSFTGRVTRDLDPTLLPVIVQLDGYEWIALQHGEAAALAPGGMLQPALPRDWAGTASLLRELDALVTTDTGIAHLAGAMAVPCVVMLQYVPDWRWGLHGTTTPWYPGMHLLRQPAPGDWPSVLSALPNALTAVLKQ